MRDSNGRFVKGHSVPQEWRDSWSEKNTGLVRSEETKMKISESTKGEKNHFYGKTHTLKSRKLISTKNIGKVSWCKGTKGLMKPNSGSFKKGMKRTKEQIRKCLYRRDKSSLESKFEMFIDKLNLPYKFVGNGKFFIEKKCPDFINVNGEKIAIEVFYRKHKDLFKGNYKNWMKERASIFERYGWKLLFFNELEVNEQTIKQKIDYGGG